MSVLTLKNGSDTTVLDVSDSGAVTATGALVSTNVGTAKIAVIAGGSAGNFTLTGITTSDALSGVVLLAGAGTDVTDISNLTSEFTITATNTINNTGGTASTGGKLLVFWQDLTL